jgi:pantoate--beta-alanine ligase
MGALAAGTLLVRRARAECASVLASIFVDPASSGRAGPPGTPPPLEADLAKLDGEGPTSSSRRSLGLYPPAFDTWVVPGRLAERLEGAVRPGHFRGVATVVLKLFNVLEPDRAYFGQKDAQQAVILRRMAADLDLGLEIVVCPIVREPDGVAMSSRNVYLSPQERMAAPCSSGR